LAWVVLQLIGGALLGVLSIGFYPFNPEQSLGHYSAHLAYGLLQVPVLMAAIGIVSVPRSPHHSHASVARECCGLPMPGSSTRSRDRVPSAQQPRT
jgi:hypothetical protein